MKLSGLNDRGSSVGKYWMRAVSFAALHRILHLVVQNPAGIRAKDLNRAIVDKGLLHGRGSDSAPSPTTLYHYRTILLRLSALRRDGVFLYVNRDERAVQLLIREPTDRCDAGSLSSVAKDYFADLVLGNRDCASLFFDSFAPCDTSIATAKSFRQYANPVEYELDTSADAVRIVLNNTVTGDQKQLRSARHRRGPPPLVQSVSYGMRYWARDKLGLVDEYYRPSGRSIIFPLISLTQSDERIRSVANQVLALRNASDWTMFAISDLIRIVCETKRQPISLLFQAIDRLLTNWPKHIVLIPSPLDLATIAASSTHHERMILSTHYRRRGMTGPYISHLRIHRAVTPYL